MALQSSAPEQIQGMEDPGAAMTPIVDAALSAVFGHVLPCAETISALVSHRGGFGLGWVLLQFMRTGRFLLPFGSLDLTDFSLGAAKLELLFSSLCFPSDPSTLLETLKCGPTVCKGRSLAVLIDFLQRLKASAGEVGGLSISLKNLILAKCDLGDTDVCVLFPSLPPSLCSLDLSDNLLRSGSMGALGRVLSFNWLPSLVDLDLSNNYLGPGGMRAFAKGLQASAHGLSLQSLKLRGTGVGAEGLGALAEGLKEGKTRSMRHLDLGSLDWDAKGVKSLTEMLNTSALPGLRSLDLSDQIGDSEDIEDEARSEGAAALGRLLSSTGLRGLEDLNLSLVWTGGGEACAKAIAARHLPNLRSLSLRETDMVPSGVLDLANAFAAGKAPELRVFRLVDCWVPDHLQSSDADPTFEVPDALVKALNSGHLSQLTVLQLQEVYDFFGAGFNSLLRCLAEGPLPVLQSLDLQALNSPPFLGGMVSLSVDEGVTALAEGMGGGKFPLLENFVFSIPSSRMKLGGECIRLLCRALVSGKVSTLKRLELSWTEEGGEGIRGLVEGLREQTPPPLEHLSLYCCFGQRDEESQGMVACREVGEILSTCKVPTLKSIELRLPDAGSLSFLCQGLLLGSLPPSLVVDLYGIVGEAGNEAVERLSEILCAGKMTGLQTLSLSGLNQEMARGFGEALTHAESSLACLERVNAGINGAEREAGIAAFLNGMRAGPSRLPSLRLLDFGGLWHGDALGVGGARGFFFVVSSGKIPSLERLHVDCRELGGEGMHAFSRTLSSPHISRLQELEVTFQEGNSGDAEMGMLSVGLGFGQLRGLQELTFGGLTGAGLETLCVGLAGGTLCSLRKLSLQQNPLGAAGGVALAGIVNAEKLPSLRELEVDHTGIGDEGVTALSEAWLERQPPPLEIMRMGVAEIGDDGLEPLVRILASGRLSLLKKFKLEGNRFSAAAKHLLCDFPSVFARYIGE
uniref:Uncharacterized protein n=1 Tax=Chromera velia CCMP2878 TaxID=1169474 RepID=A0A0G4I602_9ALVE|eukprot:Cvel_1875.t1-p1 / transcript=Cvel_1875.t1 / gene=Cvel_1875 / organism=Chromera_velia_CCMP2878 / gene_product=Ribonuclease inhibitor, putative / transcript_product=Ribonuclease inhibitor, putative / location=Cvel_scaffold69:147367-152699(+) / protein_length=969 / sequence_SO=supercontig / SO=protein_coding / is_pseudo=false